MRQALQPVGDGATGPKGVGTAARRRKEAPRMRGSPNGAMWMQMLYQQLQTLVTPPAAIGVPRLTPLPRPPS